MLLMRYVVDSVELRCGAPAHSAENVPTSYVVSQHHKDADDKRCKLDHGESGLKLQNLNGTLLGDSMLGRSNSR
eukprot:6189338-Pleurochrysis_carterae.AAC.1